MDMDLPPTEIGPSFHDPGSPVSRQAVEKLEIVLKVPLNLSSELSPSDYRLLQTLDKVGFEASADASSEAAGTAAIRFNEPHARAISCIVAEQAVREQWDLDLDEILLQNLNRAVDSLD